MINTGFYVYIVLLIIAICYGMITLKRLSMPFKIMVLLLSVTLLSELAGRYFGYVNNNSSPVYHFYALVSFWLYSYIYQLLFGTGKGKFAVLFITIPFTIFCIVNALVFQKINEFPSNSIMVSSILLVIYSLLFFRYMLDVEPLQTVTDRGNFWFNVGVLFYFSMQLFDWGMLNYMFKRGMDIMVIAYFGFAVSIIFYAILGFCIYLDSKRTVSPGSDTY